MKPLVLKLLSGFLIVGGIAFAETAGQLSTTATPAPSKIVGGVDLRPSFKTNIGEIHSENYAQLGYQFSPMFTLTYRQEFNTNVYDPTAETGMNLLAGDGFVRGKFGDLWKSGNWSSNYEARIYTPTNKIKRDAGMLTAVRNYGRLKHKFGNSLAVLVEEMPILHFYSSAGSGTGAGSANPFFENRLSVQTEITPIQNVKLTLPVYWGATRFSNFKTGAKNNNAWGHKVWFWPELIYTLTPNTAVGVAYYTDTLIKPDFSAANFSDGFKNGVTQLVVQATL